MVTGVANSRRSKEPGKQEEGRRGSFLFFPVLASVAPVVAVGSSCYLLWAFWNQPLWSLEDKQQPGGTSPERSQHQPLCALGSGKSPLFSSQS